MCSLKTVGSSSTDIGFSILRGSKSGRELPVGSGADPNTRVSRPVHFRRELTLYWRGQSKFFYFQVYKCSQPVVAALLARACIYNQLTVNTPARFSYGAFLAEASEEWVLWGTYGGQLRWERKELGERGLRHARLLLHCQLCSTCIASMPSTCSI